MGLAMLLLALPLSVFFIRSRPQDMGLLPDGDSPSSGSSNQVQTVGHSIRRPPTTDAIWTFSQALRSSTFWIITVAFVMAVTGSMGVLQHQVALLTDRGIPPTAAAAALGLTGGFSVVGKVSLGYLTDRVACRYVTAISFSLQLVGLVLLVVAPSVAWVWLFVVLFGLGMGSVPTLRPLLVGECFGLTAFGPIFGTLVGLVEVGSAVGPILSGYIFDVTQSYDLAFVIYCVMFVVAIACVCFARPTGSRGGL
jgi:predicted MFS family arabinose efflux permease